MGSLMWIILFFMLALLVVAFFWFFWRLRNFSQSHNYTVMDDKLLQSMLGDDALSKEVKKELVKQQSGRVEIPVEKDTSSESKEA